MPRTLRYLLGTLRARLILGIAAIHALLMTFFVFDQALRRREVLLRQCESEVRGHARSIAAASGDWMVTGNIAGLQGLVDRQVAGDNFAFAMITDGDGVIQAHSDPARRGQCVTDLPQGAGDTVLTRTVDLVDVASPVSVGGVRVGWVRMGMSLDGVAEEFRSVVTVGVVYILLAAALGVLVAWYTVGRLTRRLHAVQHTVARVRAGDASARSRLTGSDEAVALATEFDQMLDELSDRDRRLRESEADKSMIFDESPAAIWVQDWSAVKARLEALARLGVTDPDGYLRRNPEELDELIGLIRTRRVNRRSVELLRAPDAGTLERDARAYCGEAMTEVFRDEFVALAAGRTRHQTLAEMRDAQGAPLLVERALAVQAGAEATLAGVLVSFIDVTERRRAEEARERLVEELRTAQKLESVGRLAGGVAHDFNNMLTVILGRTEMALELMPEGREGREELVEVRVAAERSAALVRQLLAFARKQTVSPRVLNLNDAVTGMVKILRRMAGESVQLLWSPRGALWPVKIDPAQVDQILANLCVNARDAIADQGTIEISTENAVLDARDCEAMGCGEPGDYVLLSVRDDGSGMDAATLANIFEPFFTTKAPGKGTGLGLATVYGIVKQNGGFIHVESRPRHGTVFRIYLRPCADRAESAERAASAAPVRAGDAGILVVEDEPSILALVVRMLESHGYRVYPAHGPMPALELAKAPPGRIDLVLTDVVMPEMNGRDLGDLIERALPGVRRVYMSGHTADILSQTGELPDGMHFLRKPFTAAMLLDKVREVLADPAPRTLL